MKNVFRIQLPSVFVLLLGICQASAQFTFLTDNRSVGMSGETNGVQLYGQTNDSLVPFAPFTNSLADAAGGLNSSVSQKSSLTSNSIYLANEVGAGYDLTGAATGEAEAEGTFEISFSVQTPTIYSFTGFETQGDNSAPLSLTSAHHGTIMMVASKLVDTRWTNLGVLQPDTYQLNADVSISVGGAHSEDAEGVSAGFSLIALPPPQITSVGVNSNALALSVSTAALSTNRVLATTNLLNPISQWEVIATNIADTNGVFQFTNSIAPGQDTEFYQVVFP